MCDSLRSYRLWTARLFCSQNFPSKNTGVTCHALLQGIFSTQGLNMCLLSLPLCRQVFFLTKEIDEVSFNVFYLIQHQKCHGGFPGGSVGKESACQCRRYRRCGLDPWVGKIPWRSAWQVTPVFFPGESHGQRRLVGYSP